MSYIFSGTLNTRQLIKGSDRYIRSDAPTAVTADEVKLLTEKNIKTIVDLRTEEEIAKKPCPLAECEGFTYINMPVTGGNAVPVSPDDVPRSYVKMADEQMKRIIELIEGSRTNVLYFCSAGKDRTGVASAILLKRMGASDEEIAADYVQSAVNLREMLAAFAASSTDVDINVITPAERYILEFLRDADKSIFE